jgi:hypothetical protein
VLTFLGIRKKSKFGAGPSLTIPWNLPQEKNKVYIYMRDPLGFDLELSYKDVFGTAIIPYNWSAGYNIVKVRDRILMDLKDIQQLLTDTTLIVRLQNDIVSDLNVILDNIPVTYDNKYSGITRDITATLPIDVSETTKYKRLLYSHPNGGNILQAGDFLPQPDYETLSTTTTIPASYYWEIFPQTPIIGKMNNDIKGDVIFYKNWGDEYDVPDESSVTFDGGVGCLGRYTKLMNVDERRDFNSYTNNGQAWNPLQWQESIKAKLGLYKPGCQTEECNKGSYQGNPVEPSGFHSGWRATGMSLLYSAVQQMIYLYIKSLISAMVPGLYLFDSIFAFGASEYLKPDAIVGYIYNWTGIDILGWTNQVDWVIVYRSFPPATSAGEFFGVSAILSYINLQNSIDSTKIPYIRQYFYLKKQYKYFFSFSFFGFVPLIVNFVNIKTGTKYEVITQNDVSYPEWIYRSTSFTVDEDGDYYVEFTLNVIGDNIKYPGTDPDNNKHKWNGRTMIDNVILEIIDEESTFTNYSEFTFSNNVRSKEIYLSMNGKLKRFTIPKSTDLTTVNTRRNEISDFIIKSYLP